MEQPTVFDPIVCSGYITCRATNSNASHLVTSCALSGVPGRCWTCHKTLYHCLVRPSCLTMSFCFFLCFLSGLEFRYDIWFRLVSCSFHCLLRNVMNSWKIASCSWSPRRPPSFESWQHWVHSCLAMFNIIESMHIWCVQCAPAALGTNNFTCY